MKAKYYFITLLCLLSTNFILAQDNKLFEKYADTDHVTSVSISKAMFKMMPQIEAGGLNMMNMIGKIESLHILTTEKQELAPQIRKDFNKLIDKGHSELMRVNSNGTKATFYANMKEEKVKELLMFVDVDSMFTVIQLKGDFTLQDIQDITKDFHSEESKEEKKEEKKE